MIYFNIDCGYITKSPDVAIFMFVDTKGHRLLF